MHETKDVAVPEPQRGGFARFGASVGLANLGDGIAVVAWAWTASLLTRDPFWIAFLPAVLRVPWIVFSIPAGVLADRVDRRRLIVLCDAIRAAAYGAIACAVLFSMPLSEPPAQGFGDGALYIMLICAGLLIGCAEVVRDNTGQSLLPAIVPPKDLERANGILGSIETVGNEMAGPAVGAFLIALFLPAPFLAIALALLCAAILAASLPGTFAPAYRRTRGAGWRAELIECARFVWAHPMLRLLVFVTGIWNFFAEMALIALVLHVQENLASGATTYGLILAFGAVGGVCGGVLVAPLLKVVSKGNAARWMGATTAPVFLLFAVAPGPATVAAAMFVFSLSGVIWDAVSVSYRQRVVPDGIRGRVNSVYRLFAWGTMPLGLLASGAMVNIAENSLDRSTALIVPFIVAAFGILVLSVITWRPIGRGFQ
ncbi:MFS transporter [Cognatiyoonia sp. IB215446]|uniref:MFS transporter n=1 Tax=Cognatiyoonia sp. IB215446 TaxID=3097355 RepID=UPI002A1145CB|nr:MFS transporter [Cognatiyoonia sp. IB215446]MDX8350472.1 MFS transporter [Cognatiyoonia sp. IB215446]